MSTIREDYNSRIAELQGQSSQLNSLETKVYGEIRGRIVSLIVNYDQSLDPLTDALAMKALLILRSTQLGKTYLEKGEIPTDVIELFARRVALPKPTDKNAHRFKAYEKLLGQVFAKHYGIAATSGTLKKKEALETILRGPLTPHSRPINKPLREVLKRKKESPLQQIKQLVKRLTAAYRKEQARQEVELKTLAVENSMERNIANRQEDILRSIIAHS